MKSALATRIFAILFVVMSVICSQAQTAVSWLPGSGNWSQASFWSGGVVPNNGGGKTYNVTISNGISETVSLNLAVTISDLTMGDLATLQSVANESLTIASGGTFTIQSGSLVNFTTTGSNITVASGGTLVNNGTLNLEAAGETLSVTGTTTNTGTLDLEGGIAATFTGSVTNSGEFETGFSGGNNTVNVSGTFTNNAGATLAVDGSGDVVNVNALTNSGMLSVAAGATLNITGGGQGFTDVVAGSNITLGGTLNVINGSKTTSGLGNLTTVAGTLNLQNNQTTAVTPSGGTLSIVGGGEVELSGSTGSTTTVSVTGNVSNSGEFTTGFAGGANTVSVSGTFTNASGAEMILYGTNDVVNVNALSNSGLLQIGSVPGSGAILNITGGGQGVTDIVAGSTINLLGSLNVINSGKSTNGLANLTTVAGTLNLQNNQTTAITPGGGTLSIASGGETELSGTTASTTTLSVTGNVSNSGDFTTGFAGGTNTVNVSGTFTNASGAEMILYGTNDVVNVNGLSNSGLLQIGDAPGSGATLNITGGGQGVTDIVAGSTIDLYGNLNVVNGGRSTNGLAKLTTVAGTLNLSNNQTTAVTPSGGSLTIASSGEVELSGTTASTTTLSITGNVNNSGSFNTGFAGGTNTVTVTGTFTNNSGAFLDIYAGSGSGTGTDLVNIATLTNSGTVSLLGTGSTLDITGTGTLTNSGSINLTQGALKFNSSTATLTGGGTVTLGNSSGTETGVIDVGSNDTGTLTNSSGTITGYGNLGNGTLTLVNKGTISANGNVSSGALTIQPGSAGMTNSGTLEAANQGTLILKGTYTNTGGTIEALGESGGTVSSTVQLTGGAVINGGTLTTTTVNGNSGLIEGIGAVTLNGITNSGTYAVNAGTTTTLEGTIANSGSITLSGSTLSLGNSVTLTGKGTVVLSNSATNLITAATSGLTLTNGNTIEGAGTIQDMGIVNTGTIEANQSTPLIILPSSAGLNNKGTLSVSTGDTMQIGTSAGGALLNFSGTTLTGGTYTVNGTLEFGTSGTSVVTDAANITLTGSAAKIIDFANQNVLTDLATITSAGSFTIGSGANFTTAGNFTNDGKLTVNSGSTFKVTGSLTNFNSSSDTLTGGTYTVAGKLDFAGADIVTDAANLTMSGTGEILNSTNSSNGLTNLATITAAGSFTLSGRANFTTVGNLTDNGKLTVSSGSALTVTDDLTNFNSSTDTLSSGTYTVGGTLEFTGANIVNNAANLTISGTAAKILNGTANGLANFANNTGEFTVTADGNFTTGSTAFTNSGTVTVAKGSTMTIGGGDSYTQSAGTTTVDGTLSASSGINVTGGTILGAGTLSVGNVTVGGSGAAPTISAGDSGKAGLLVITGSYTQLSSATMNSFIGGATAGTQYSQLQVGGTASLAGTLTVTLASGFTPTIGSTFTVLTAGSVTGTFSNSTIAINSTEHFNVSYTSTGVLLTVASGAAPQSGGPAKSGIVATLPRRAPVMTSEPSHRIGTSSGRILFVGMRNTEARSAVVLPAEGLTRSGDSNNLLEYSRIPATWEHAPITAHIAELPPGGERINASNNLASPVRGVESWRMPTSGTSTQRTPVKILPPIMTHVLQR
jgi:fibronectin-binding autotransporter adhesin